ncbi:ApeA N-terminal domain 1-containing protein [Emticicia fluvialis]|uniref:ApeA N-terminal domain 1-containing protein n=1 Tax=Emticicia fluvialis TaxID=2974474 RepID=UPI00216610AD|nr:HEPN domain-containing protein [Emticicia fluvialis]
MNQKFKIKGQWFLPENIHDKYSGTLAYDSVNGAYLELFGIFNSYSSTIGVSMYESIWGITSSGQRITLFKSYVFNSSLSFSNIDFENEISFAKYRVNIVLIGLHSHDYCENEFTSIKCQIFYLDNWIGINNFDLNLETDELRLKNIIVNYKRKDPIEFQIDDNTLGSFSWNINYSTNEKHKIGIKLEQEVVFEVKSNILKKIPDLYRYLKRFCDFLILAIYKNTYIHNIRLYNSQLNESYELFFSITNFEENVESKNYSSLIFCYHDVQHNFESLIKSWFEKYALYENCFYLLLDQFYNRNRFNENNFLNLAQSAEAFHSKISNKTRFPKDEYETMKREILDSTPQKYHNWLIEQFVFGNSINLHLRLEDLINRYSNEMLNKLIGDSNKFILEIKYSRNYYTHYSKNLEKKALKGMRLRLLSEKLKILIVYALLVEIGLERQFLGEAIYKHNVEIFKRF